MELITFPGGQPIAAPVIEIPNTLPDAAERAQALDVRSSWIVEAPAGSGKTGLLIQRYLKLLPTVDDPAEVLALTFTNKATAEMVERVTGALRAARDESPAPKNEFEQLTRDLATAALRHAEARDWRILERPQRLNIRTIDSLCGEIARSVPLLAEGTGAGRPLRDASAMYARAAHAVMMRFGGDDAQLNADVRTVLLHRDGDLHFCERVLAEMLGSREQWGHLVPLAEELDDATLDATVLPRLNESLERMVCAGLAEIRAGFDDDALCEVAEIARRIAAAEGYGAGPNPFAVCAEMGVPPGCSAEELEHWQRIATLLLTGDERKPKWRSGFNPNHIFAVAEKYDRERLRELIGGMQSDELLELLHGVRKLPAAVYPAEQWPVAKALFRLLRLALVELRILFAEEGVCDFTAIALAAREALEHNTGEVHVALGTGLRHLLVDEMQDTSSLQYGLLQLLTDGWDGASQTVFLVGDPKQSIYLFRQARVELFQRSFDTGRLGQLRLGSLRLCANLRSGRGLVEQFNEAFQTMFPESDPADGDVTYTGAVAARPAGAADGIEWRVSTVAYDEDLGVKRQRRRRAMRREARGIADSVAEWQREQPNAKIAVLTRARSHVTEVARELAGRGIAYRAVEIEGLAERPEVLDAAALTRALLHPADRTAWLAVLRAPWCGASMAELHVLAAGDDGSRRRQSLRLHLRERAALLPAQAQSRIGRTLDVMDAALRHGGAASLADRVERTWRSLGGDACTDGPGRENVRQFLRVLDEMEADDEAVTAASLAERLQRLFAGASHDAAAVEIMTIHKAKGLEFDLVLVPGLHRVSATSRYQALDWLELPSHGPDGSRDLLLAPVPPQTGDVTALAAYIKNTRSRRAEMELKRLFYVAATRAKTRLWLSAWPEETVKGEPIVVGRTLLKAAWGTAQMHLKARPAVAEAAAQVEEFAEPLALAASAEDAEPAIKLPETLRLSAGYDPLERLRRGALPASVAVPPLPAKPFARPEGSFGARAVGLAIHDFTERLLRAVSLQGNSPDWDGLEREASAWGPAIRATLRSGGLPPAEVGRAAVTVERALANLLRADGRWLLLPHREAAAEAAWRSDGGLRVRLDRSFFAGDAPGSPGDGTLWIVDWKTGDTDRDADGFLAAERVKYESQLRTYAELRLRSLPEGTPVMLALFYPLMGRMVSWRYEAEAVAAPILDPVVDRKGQFSLFG